MTNNYKLPNSIAKVIDNSLVFSHFWIRERRIFLNVHYKHCSFF